MKTIRHVPKNLLYLHEGEEKLRLDSIKLVEQHSDLIDHLEIIEKTMNLLDGFVRLQIENDDDGRAIQHLAIRMFNGFASTWKLTASGYYQKAAMIQRDQIETVSLADYFHREPSKISEWRSADRKELINNFGPDKIRKDLDAKSGKGKSQREEIYRKFSNLAGHPTKIGFEMLRPSGSNAIIGPFVDLTALRALLEEAAQLAVQAGHVFLTFVDITSHPGSSNSQYFLTGAMKWSEKYLGIKYTTADYAFIENLFDDIRSNH